MRYRKFLNALMLGEDEAAYLGFNVQRAFMAVILLNTLMVATATALVGVIAFVGLIVPHILRILRSSDYMFLLPASALLGAIIMELVDVLARIIIMPAELPVGIITAVAGAPLFLFILSRRKLLAS
jgi:iron complex transport system permease protein